MQRHKQNKVKEERGAVESLSHDQRSDEDLLHAIVGGADWALETLYQRYSHRLYSLAYRMVDNTQIAEELVQDTFLSIWRNAASYSPTAGASSRWLMSILHHRAINYLRKVRRRSHLVQVTLEELESDERNACPDAGEQAWQSILCIQVRTALLHIPVEQRMMIELAYFQGYTHIEISQAFHIPLGTVKARMRLGLSHLKRVLADMGIDEL